MALSQYEKMKINEYLQGYVVDSYLELIPEDKSLSMTEVLDVLLKFFDKGLENKRKNTYLLNCLIGIMTCVDDLSKSGYGVDEEHIDLILQIKEKYQKFAKNHNIDNTQLEAVIERIDRYVFMTDMDKTLENEENDIDTKEEKIDEEAIKKDMMDKIATSYVELNEENKELRKENESLRKGNKAIQKNLNNKDRQLTNINAELAALKKKQKENDKEVINLNKEINSLKDKLKDKENQLRYLSQNIRGYENQQNELLKLRSEVTEYRKKEKFWYNQSSPSQKEILKSNAKKTIVDILMNKACTFEEIEKELKIRKISLNRLELFTFLKEIQRDYQVDVNIKKDGAFSYYIISPIIIQNKRVSLPTDKKVLDVMLTADWHLYSLEDKDFKRIDTLYEYCVKNNINIMFNLGDFIDFSCDYNISDKRAKVFYDVRNRVEKLAKKIPYDKSVFQYVLGGNHDEYLRRLRLDVISLLANCRPDILSLGYNHAFVDINNSTFALHHPDKMYNTLKEYREYLTKYYNTSNINIKYEDVYMNLFGHFHAFKYFNQDGYLSIPSLTRDAKGAIHLRLHFGKSAEIAFVEIIPLTYSNGLNREKAKKYTKKLN